MIDAIGLPAEWQEPSRRRKIENGVEVFEHGSVGDRAASFERIHSPNPNVLKSEAAKFPVFDEQEIMKIKTAGDKLNVHAEIITGKTWRNPHFSAFKPMYDKWKEGQRFGGTQIFDWSAASVGERASLIHQNILTVEQFAEMPDEKVQTLPFGIKELHARARTEVAAKNAKPDIEGYISEIVELRKKVEKLEAGSLDTEPAKKRGRPKKESIYE